MGKTGWGVQRGGGGGGMGAMRFLDVCNNASGPFSIVEGAEDLE